MSVTAQDIYDQVCFVMNEDGGLVLGLYSLADFLHALGVVMFDFSQRAPLDKKIVTEQILASTSVYIVPDDLQRPDLVFVSGKIIEKVSEDDLTRGHLDWKTRTGPPEQCHEDNLPPKQIEVTPTPVTTGAAIAAPGWKYGDFFPAERNLSMVGPALPAAFEWSLGDTLEGIPDSFGPYLVHGVLEKIFDAEGETRDIQRAHYCHTRYEEGILLANAISNDELLEGDD